MRRLWMAGLAALVTMTGCAGGLAGSAPLAKASLVGGDVVVAGTDGYCVDPVTLNRGTNRHFAVIASCNILSGGEAGRYVPPMMLTVTVGTSVGATPLPGPEALAREAGEQLLDGTTRDGLVIARLSDGGEAVLDGGDPRYWRGAFVQNGHLVGLALYAPDGSALTGGQGADMLRAVRDRIRDLSPS